MKRTILITAPKGYAERLDAALRAVSEPVGLCFAPVAVPLIETEAMPTTDGTRALRSTLQDVDVVVFTSRKAIEAVHYCCRHDTGMLSPEASYVAIGRDATLMTALLGKPQGLPDCEPSLMGIVKALAGMPGAGEKRVVVLRPRVVGMPEPATVPEFLETLGGVVGEVRYLPVYTTRSASGETRQTVRNLLRQGIDCVALTSGGEAQVFRQVLEDGPEQMSLPVHTTLACFGPFTAKCARTEGLPVHFVSDRYHSFTAFAERLKQYLSSV